MKGTQAGSWGEAQAAAYLRRRGYTIVAANYRCRFGEIDLIARDGETLCFVEVKLRSTFAHGLPREFVTTAKQRRLRTAAAQYLVSHEPGAPVRFDVAEVYTDAAHTDANTRIEYIENAFE